jgi:hypothetical protein
MAHRALVAAALSFVAVTTAAFARAPAPLVPIALVEDVKSATAGVEFMDYVGNGQVIRLGADDVLVLSYLKSCEHETITGGTVTVGMQRSAVQDGKVVRAKVPCDDGKMQLVAQQASQSAATAFRLQSAQTQQTVYARTPVIRFPRLLARADRDLLIERTDRKGERYEVKIDDTVAATGFYDLAETKISLARGATYDATIGEHKMTFRIDPKAKSDRTPVVSRLLRFQ